MTSPDENIQSPSLDTGNLKLVQLANGAFSVHSIAHRETFHPVIGPVAEAEALYVKQLNLVERARRHTGEFVIWDVGLGAAANPLTALRALAGVPCSIRILSFDHTLEPLQFALQNADTLSYIQGFEKPLGQLLEHQRAEFSHGQAAIVWEVFHGDFPSLLRRLCAEKSVSGSIPLASPHAILFDAYSPATNSAMWTLPLFADLHSLLDPQCPCAMPTYSRSTLMRVTLLLAGFFVGAGHATGEKEETTIAANTLDLITEPLDRRWLQRVRRSTSAEPLKDTTYRQAPLSPESWEKLLAHPQFAGLAI